MLRRFPLLIDAEYRKKHPMWWPRWIPWAIAEQAYKEYERRGHGDQSLGLVAKRLGFGPYEIDALLAGDYTSSGFARLKRGEEDFVHAGGMCVCDRCGLKYVDHPRSPHYLDQDGRPYLNRLCDGRLVKL